MGHLLHLTPTTRAIETDGLPGDERTQQARPSELRKRILVIDVGGTNVKVLAAGALEPRKTPSGRKLTPSKMIESVRALAEDWQYDAVSIGFPGLVGKSGPICEPGNLGKGWVGFDWAAALERPVKVANDAAMQALGSYEGGRMLFLGLGTGVGAALIAEHSILPLEIGDLPWQKERTTIGDVLSREGLRRQGLRAWRRAVDVVACRLMKMFVADYVVLGGGNAKKLKQLPHGMRLGHNQTAFRGGFRLWGVEDVPVQSPNEPPSDTVPVEWRLI